MGTESLRSRLIAAGVITGLSALIGVLFYVFIGKPLDASTPPNINEIHNPVPLHIRRPDLNIKETRLPVIRRLHLEHPDLIPYPLFIERYA